MLLILKDNLSKPIETYQNHYKIIENLARPAENLYKTHENLYKTYENLYKTHEHLCKTHENLYKTLKPLSAQPRSSARPPLPPKPRAPWPGALFPPPPGQPWLCLGPSRPSRIAGLGLCTQRRGFP